MPPRKNMEASGKEILGPLRALFRHPLITILGFIATVIVISLWSNAILIFYASITWEDPTPWQAFIGALISSIIIYLIIIILIFLVRLVGREKKIEYVFL
jgi:hypothetical protein